MALVDAQPELTLDKVCASLGTPGGAPGQVPVCRFFSRYGISFNFKETRTLPSWTAWTRRSGGGAGSVHAAR